MEEDLPAAEQELLLGEEDLEGRDSPRDEQQQGFKVSDLG